MTPALLPTAHAVDARESGAPKERNGLSQLSQPRCWTRRAKQASQGLHSAAGPAAQKHCLAEQALNRSSRRSARRARDAGTLPSPSGATAAAQPRQANRRGQVGAACEGRRALRNSLAQHVQLCAIDTLSQVHVLWAPIPPFTKSGGERLRAPRQKRRICRQYAGVTAAARGSPGRSPRFGWRPVAATPPAPPARGAQQTQTRGCGVPQRRRRKYRKTSDRPAARPATIACHLGPENESCNPGTQTSSAVSYP